MDTKGSPDTVQDKVYIACSSSCSTCTTKLYYTAMPTAKPFEKRKRGERKLPQLTRVVQTRVFSEDPLPTAVSLKSGQYSLDGLCEEALLEGIHFSGVGYRKR